MYVPEGSAVLTILEKKTLGCWWGKYGCELQIGRDTLMLKPHSPESRNKHWGGGGSARRHLLKVFEMHALYQSLRIHRIVH